MKLRDFSLLQRASFAQDIEQILSTYKCFGVPLGKTIGSFLYQSFVTLAPELTFKDAILNITRFLRIILIIPSKNPRCGGFANYSNRILITLTRERSELKGLVDPLLEKFPKDKIFLIGHHNVCQGEKYKGVDFLSWENFSHPSPDWKLEYFSNFRIVATKLIRYFHENRISICLTITLLYYLLIQTRRISSIRNFFNECKPSFILTDFDRNIENSPLILLANSLNIPTATMIHGVINSIYSGYTPLIADYAFCWGKEQVDQLIALGEPSTKLVITGCQRLNKPIYKKSYVNHSGSLNVLLATSPIEKVERKEFVRCFIRSVLKFGEENEIRGIIRLHPSENIKFYEKEIREYPEIKFTSNSDYRKEELIEIADVVVCLDSGFGNDALLSFKPIIILNPTKRSLGNGKALIDNEVAMYAEDEMEFIKCLKFIVDDQKKYPQTIEAIEKYIQYFCAYFGAEAAQVVVDSIGVLQNVET